MRYTEEGENSLGLEIEAPTMANLKDLAQMAVSLIHHARQEMELLVVDTEGPELLTLLQASNYTGAEIAALDAYSTFDSVFNNLERRVKPELLLLQEILQKTARYRNHFSGRCPRHV